MSLLAIEHWSNLACAGGIAQQDLGRATAVREVLAVDGADSLAFVLPRAMVKRRSFGLRQVVRLVDSLGEVREYRVRRIDYDPQGATANVVCAPAIADLATAGLVRGLDGGTTITASLTPAQWIDTYVLSNLANDQLTWLGRGVVEYTSYITMTIEAVTRLGLLRELAAKLGAELQLRRSGDTAYLIDLVAQIGSSAAPAVALYGRNLVMASLEEDDATLATVIQPTGTRPNANAAPVTLKQMAWRITNIAGTGPFAITLADAMGGAGPVGFDDQLNGLYLEAKDATRYQILDSVASSQTVVVASTGTMSLGMQVGVVRTSGGDAAYEVMAPAAAALSGRVAAPLVVGAARGERNLLTDGNFAYAGTGYVTAVGGWRELYPVADTADIAGTVSSSTSSSTSLPVSGFPANATIKRGERLNVGALVIATTSTPFIVDIGGAGVNNTFSSSAGTSASVALSGTLGANVSDNQPLAATNGFGTVAVNGAQSAGATSLAIKNIPAYRKLFNLDKIVVSRGGTFVALLQSDVTVTNTMPIEQTKIFSIPVNYQGFRLNGSGRNPDAQPSNNITVELFNYANGQTYYLNLYAGQNMQGTTFTVGMVVPANSSVTLNAGAYLSLTQYGEATIELTQATAMWDTTTREVAVTFTAFPGIVIDGVTRAAETDQRVKWTTNAGVQIASAGGVGSPLLVGTLAAGATSATLRNTDVRVWPAGTTFSAAGSALYTGATTTLNSSGVGTLTLSAAFSATNGQSVTVDRREEGYLLNGGGLNLLRMVATQKSETVTIPVPSGTMPLLARARLHVWRTTGAASTGVGVSLSIMNNATGTALASASQNLAALQYQVIELTVAHSLAATTTVYLNVNSTASETSLDYQVCLEWFALYKETSDATIPFTAGSYANLLWQEANVALAERALAPRTVRATVADLCRVLGVTLEPFVLVKGGRLQFEALGITSRIVGLDLNHDDPAQSALTLDTMPARVSALV